MRRNQSYLHNLKDLAHEPGEEKPQEPLHENALIFEKNSSDQIEELIQQNQSMRQALVEEMTN